MLRRRALLAHLYRIKSTRHENNAHFWSGWIANFTESLVTKFTLTNFFIIKNGSERGTYTDGMFCSSLCAGSYRPTLCLSVSGPQTRIGAGLESFLLHDSLVHLQLAVLLLSPIYSC